MESGSLWHCFTDYVVKTEHDILCKIVPGVLYRLRSSHPVIDGVGLLPAGWPGEYWLVFVQISMETYAQHGSKLSNMFDDKKDQKGYKELATDNLSSIGPSTTTDLPLSLFDYYQELVSRSEVINFSKQNTIYFYASMRTYFSSDIKVFRAIQEHSQDLCQIGLLSQDSELYKSFIRLCS